MKPSFMLKLSHIPEKNSFLYFFSIGWQFWLPNPLHCNITVHILLPVLFTFLKVLIRRICSTIKSFFSSWSFPLFLTLLAWLRGQIVERNYMLVTLGGQRVKRRPILLGFCFWRLIWSLCGSFLAPAPSF